MLAKGICHMHYERLRKTGILGLRPNTPRPRGTGTVTEHGYIRVKVGNRRLMSQRVIMEAKIGRPLFDDETVHHVDGNRQHNEPSNLELWSSRHPKGQRVDEKVIFARDILDRYGFRPEIFNASEAASGLMAM
jgi:hypothetical protein